MTNLSQQLVPQLTREQRTIFDTITQAALNNEGGLYMIDAPAGTGKTFTECAISAHTGNSSPCLTWRIDSAFHIQTSFW